MESSYGVGVKNRFDLFIDDENDPLDVMAETERRKEDSKDVKKETKPVKKTVEKKTVENVKSSPKSETSGRKEGDQGEKKTGKADRERRGPPSGSSDDRDRNSTAPRYANNNNNNERRKVTFSDSSKSSSTETKGEDRDQPGQSFRGRGRGGRGGRGMGRVRREYEGRIRRDFEGRGKREFDRRSGSDKSTYRGPNEKRDGGGSHNWGSMADDSGQEAEVFDEVTGSKQEKTTTDWAASDDTEKKEASEENVEETNEGGEESAANEENAKQMTLDEYKAEQEKLKTKAHFKLRKPSEGEDSKKWAKAVPIQRSDDFETEYAKMDDGDKGHKSGRVKETVSNIRIRFNDPPTTRGRGRGRGESDSRGGRGSGRGRGGSGYYTRRQNSSEKSQADTTPNFENQEDFPALGGN